MTPPPLSLAELRAWVPEGRLWGEPTVRVGDVYQDSRRVVPGALFAARSGTRVDGRAFVEDAIRRGAVALLTDDPALAATATIPGWLVPNVQTALGPVAAAIYGVSGPTSPELIGVTGTNGKTTVTWLIGAMLQALGRRPALLGTLGGSFDGEELPGTLTTPEADDTARLWADVGRRGAHHLVMEVSSHALALGRVDGFPFRAAAFTNLSRDHLDFHGTMAAYGAAKARLFTDLAPAVAVLNVEDPFGAALSEQVRGPLWRVSPTGVHEAELVGRNGSSSIQGSTGVFAARGEQIPFSSPLLGAHNRENLAIALGVVLALGFPLREAVRGLAAAPPVPGRLERCSTGDDAITVVVDYAHTPDALQHVLRTLRPLTTGQVWCVFGCGGDRDPGKRALMGEVAGRESEKPIITDDNPRHESAKAIAQGIAAGVAATGRPFVTIHDRAEAIDYAIGKADPGDLVLIAGKGHETEQIIGPQRYLFDDRVAARRALRERRERT